MPDTPDAPAYRHVQTYRMLWVVLLVTAGFGGVMLAEAPTGRSGASWGGLLLMAASLGGALVCLGRLVIEVHARELRWHFGYIGWPGWSVPLAQVKRTEVIRTRFAWGSGIRGPLAHRLYNVRLGGPALMVHLLDGRSVTLGTPEPQRLQDCIQARLPAARP